MLVIIVEDINFVLLPAVSLISISVAFDFILPPFPFVSPPTAASSYIPLDMKFNYYTVSNLDPPGPTRHIQQKFHLVVNEFILVDNMNLIPAATSFGPFSESISNMNYGVSPTNHIWTISIWPMTTVNYAQATSSGSKIELRFTNGWIILNNNLIDNV